MRTIGKQWSRSSMRGRLPNALTRIRSDCIVVSFHEDEGGGHEEKEWHGLLSADEIRAPRAGSPDGASWRGMLR